MHSSRMRTACSSSHPRGSLHQAPPGLGTPPGPDTPWDQTPPTPLEQTPPGDLLQGMLGYHLQCMLG